MPSEKFRDKLKATLDDYMTTMKRELDSPPTHDEIKRLFLKHCAECLDVTPEADEPTVAERETIAAQETSLTDPDWTYREGHKFVDMGVKISADTHLTEAAHKAPGGLIRVQLLERDTTHRRSYAFGRFHLSAAHGHRCARKRPGRNQTGRTGAHRGGGSQHETA